MNDINPENATDIPAVLLSNCWALIAAERRRIRTERLSDAETTSFSPAFLRSLYNRFDEDRDGRLDFEEMHNIFNIYMSDIIEGEMELPREFTNCVIKAVFTPEKEGTVRWSEFQTGFPIAIRQRRTLWDEWGRRQDLHPYNPDDPKQNPELFT